jgi:NRPS condensation-like uncharacterized protein
MVHGIRHRPAEMAAANQYRLICYGYNHLFHTRNNYNIQKQQNQMNIFHICGLVVLIIIASFLAAFLLTPQHQPEMILWEYGNPSSDSTTQSFNPVDISETLTQELKALVESKGYTWEQWLRNDIPRNIKWEITSQHSANLKKYE